MEATKNTSLSVTYGIRTQSHQWVDEAEFKKYPVNQISLLLPNEEVQGRVIFILGDISLTVEDELLPMFSLLCVETARNLSQEKSYEYLGWDHPAKLFFECSRDEVVIAYWDNPHLVVLRKELINELKSCVERFLATAISVLANEPINQYLLDLKSQVETLEIDKK